MPSITTNPSSFSLWGISIVDGEVNLNTLGIVIRLREEENLVLRIKKRFEDEEHVDMFYESRGDNLKQIVKNLTELQKEVLNKYPYFTPKLYPESNIC